MNNEKYKENIEKIIKDNKLDQRVSKIIYRLYDYIHNNNWWGACHACSSVLLVSLSELGLKPTLCVGVAKKGNIYFDHSWITLNGKIIDLAICMTMNCGKAASEPIVMNINLENGKINEDVEYGVGQFDLDFETIVYIKTPFVLYMDSYPMCKNGLWDIVNYVLGKESAPDKYRKKYKHVKKRIF